MLHQRSLGDDERAMRRPAVRKVHKYEDGCEDEFGRWVRAEVCMCRGRERGSASAIGPVGGSSRSTTSGM